MSERFDVLGVDVDAFSKEMLLDHIDSTIREGGRSLIANHNLHSVYLYHHDKSTHEFYQRADVIIIDGMSIIFAGKLRGHPLNYSHRLAWTDMVFPVAEAAAENAWRVFFLGSSPGVGEKSGDRLRSSFPRLRYECRPGYFDMSSDGQENRDIVHQINQYQPNLLLVGMGMPRQEQWLLENIDKLNCNVACSVGACMDFVAGTKPVPPRQLGPYGLEWLYRLSREPVRLFRRYLVEPWSLLKYLFR